MFPSNQFDSKAKSQKNQNEKNIYWHWSRYLILNSVVAQFDTEFYMPPMWLTDDANTNDPSELVITTPYPAANVRVFTADGTNV